MSVKATTDRVDAPVSNHLAQLLELPGGGVASAAAGGVAVLVAHRILPVIARPMYLGAAAIRGRYCGACRARRPAWPARSGQRRQTRSRRRSAPNTT